MEQGQRRERQAAPDAAEERGEQLKEAMAPGSEHGQRGSPAPNDPNAGSPRTARGRGRQRCRGRELGSENRGDEGEGEGAVGVEK